MKKAAISIITCICMLVGMLSFSLPVNAASPTYVGGDVIYDIINRGTNVSIGSLVNTMKNDGSYSAQSSYINDTADTYHSTNSLFHTKGNIVFYLSDGGIPSNSHVIVEFGLRVWYVPSTLSCQFYDFDMIPGNPATSFKWSCQSYYKSGDFDREYFYRVAFDTPVLTREIIFNQCDTCLRVVGVDGTKYTPSIYLLDCRVSYTPIDTNPNRDVLVDIRDNTGATTDAVNNQTETVTNGYDNSSMSDDNTRLNDQIAQYDQAQESATNTSVSNIDAAEFFNPSSNTSVFAAMTFSASFLQSLYNNLGDFGIVVMVSLSLCLGLMLVGWFKYRKGG